MPRHVDIVIVGSGFSGLGMAIQLKRAGRHDFVILEKASDLGGTWRDNTYPGCACDVSSYVYSYSFAQNPRWSRLFSPQPEIYDYLRQCARRWGVDAHLELGSRVTATVYDETSARWDVEVEGSETLSCRILVAGVGALHLPRLPDLPGLERFTGTTFHSADWRHDRDLTGQRVAVVGTGASAVQLVPEIADQVAHLDLYQRTPAWLVPKDDKLISTGRRRRYERYPITQRVVRDFRYWMLEARGVGFTVSTKFLPAMEHVSRGHLRSQVPDPDLRARLTPDYRMGCKRVLPSSNFYPSLQKPQVELVTDEIETFTATGLRDTAGVERAVDTVIFATGFDLKGNLEQIRIVGKGAVSLEETWDKQGVNAHHGIMVSGFPNLFLLLGPNTGLGHNSVVFMIESQVAFVLRALRRLDESGGRQIDVLPQAQQRSVGRVQRRLARSVWQSGCRSWYQDESGRNYAIWPRSTMRYWLAVRRLRPRDYRMSRISATPFREEQEIP